MKRDLREYAKKTNIRILVGFVFLLMVVGVGLIYLIYGLNAAITGFFCILGGLFPAVVIIILMVLLDIVVKKAND